MSDSEISLETFLKVLRQMGYSILREERGMIALNYSKEVKPIFIYIGTVTHLPLDTIELFLEENGINRAVFHANWESI